MILDVAKFWKFYNHLNRYVGTLITIEMIIINSTIRLFAEASCAKPTVLFHSVRWQCPGGVVLSPLYR